MGLNRKLYEKNKSLMRIEINAKFRTWLAGEVQDAQAGLDLNPNGLVEQHGWHIAWHYQREWQAEK